MRNEEIQAIDNDSLEKLYYQTSKDLRKALKVYSDLLAEMERRDLK